VRTLWTQCGSAISNRRGKEWEIKDVGEKEYFLGMRVQQDLERGMIRLSQRPYWEHVINRFDLAHVVL